MERHGLAGRRQREGWRALPSREVFEVLRQCRILLKGPVCQRLLLQRKQ